MATEQDKLIIKIQADTDKAIKEVKSLTKELNLLSKNVKKNSTTFKTHGTALTKMTGTVGSLVKKLGVLATAYLSFEGAKKLISVTAEIEEGFIGVAKTTGLVGEELKILETGILDLSQEMAGVSIEGLQSVAETAGQLGIKGVDNILEFTRVITMMGTATDLSAEEAAVGMAKLGNVLQEPIGNVEKLGSVMNELSNNTTATTRDLLEIGLRLGSVGKEFGLSSAEVLGFGATIKDLGLSTEVGATAVSNLLVAMLKDTVSFAKVSGQTFEEYSNLIRTKPVEAIQVFLKSLDKLSSSEKALVLEDLKLGANRSFTAMLKLSGATELLAENFSMANKEFAINTSLQKEYDVASAGFNAQMERLKNSVSRLAYEIGVSLLPVMKDIVEDTVEWIKTLDKEDIKSFGETISALITIFISLKDVLIWLSDYTMPDWLIKGKEDQDNGWLDLIVEALKDTKTHLEALGYAWDVLDLEDKTLTATAQFEDLVEQVKYFAGTADDFKPLQTAIINQIDANNKLIETYDIGERSTQAVKDAVKLLKEENEQLAQELLKLHNMENVHKKQEEGAKSATKAEAELAENMKKYSEETIETMVDTADQRLKITNDTIKTLKSSEASLTAEIKKLQDKLIQDLKKIGLDRLKTNESIMSQISDLERGLLGEKEGYLAQQLEAEEALGKAKEALLAGELDKYRIYIDKYKQLITEGAGHAVEQDGKEVISKEKTTANAIAGLKQVQTLENSYYSAKEAKRIELHNQEVAHKKAELALVKIQLEAQEALMKALEKMILELTGKKLDLDYTAISKAKEGVDELIKNVDVVNKLTPEVLMETGQVKQAEGDVKSLQSTAKEGATVNVDANTNDLKQEATKGKDEVENTPVIMTISAKDGTELEQVNIRNKVESIPAFMEISAKDKTGQVVVETIDIIEAKSPVMSIEAETSKADAPIEALNQKASTPVVKPVDADTSSAIPKVSELQTKAEAPASKKVDLDTTGANTEITALEADIAKPVTKKVILDLGDASARLNALNQEAEKRVVKPVEANVDNAISSVKRLAEIIAKPSTHYVRIDAKNAFDTIRTLQKTTYSTHIIRIKEVRASALGGPMPQRLASGGPFVGSGRVPGYDPTDSDKVNAILTGGEFVINRQATDYIGRDFLEGVNRMLIPKDRQYALGGYVAPTQSVNKSGGNTALQPINLNIGGNSFETMATKEIADAIVYSLKYEGGT